MLPFTLTSPLLLLFSCNQHLIFIQLKVGFHLLNGRIRDGKAKFLQKRNKFSSWDFRISGSLHTFSAIARLSHSFLHVLERIWSGCDRFR